MGKKLKLIGDGIYVNQGRFEKRVEAILGRTYQIFSYRECPSHGWVEMNLRPFKKTHDKASAYIDVTKMVQLSKLFGTKQVRVTAYDISSEDDGSDYVLYVLAEGLKKRKK